MLEKMETVDHVVRMFVNVPHAKMVFYGMFAGTWLIGGNLLVAMHYRRIGKPWWSGFRPFSCPFGNFNLFEWLSLIILGAVAFFFGGLALALGHLK